jgi:hypothetical protein
MPVEKEGVNAVAPELGFYHAAHPPNRGYRRHQETYYSRALAHDADIVVKLPPDYQSSAKALAGHRRHVASGHPWTRDWQLPIPTLGAELAPAVRRL